MADFDKESMSEGSDIENDSDLEVIIQNFVYNFKKNLLIYTCVDCLIVARGVCSR